MCLDTIDSEVKVREGIGWKCFWKRGQQLEGILQHETLPVGKWVTDKKICTLASCEDKSLYQTGYHLSPTKQDAETAWNSNVIRPVEFRSVVATGTQIGVDSESHPVIVAREIRIFTAKEAREYGRLDRQTETQKS